MSLYTFAATNLTTPADLRRRPAIDKGQLVRTLVLFVAVAIAMAVFVHKGRGGGPLSADVMTEAAAPRG